MIFDIKKLFSYIKENNITAYPLSISQDEHQSYIYLAIAGENYKRIAEEIEFALGVFINPVLKEPGLIKNMLLHKTKIPVRKIKKQPRTSAIKELFAEKIMAASNYLYTLEILTGKQAGKKLNVKSKLVTIGRKSSGKKGEIIIEDNSISKQHIEINVVSNDDIRIKDLNSTNGTIVNGVLVKDFEINLKDGDIIKLGQTNIKFSLKKN